jgi:uridine kinase
MATQITRAQIISERATLQFIAWTQYNSLFNSFLKVEHSLGDAIYCTDLKGKKITDEMCKEFQDSMMSVLNSDDEIQFVQLPREQIIEHFIALEMQDKVGILKTWQEEMIPCIKLNDSIDYVIEPMSTNKERLKIFEIRRYMEGLVIRFPTLSYPTELKEWKDPIVTLKMFSEYHEWAELIGVNYVSMLNDVIYKGKINDIKWVAEGLHDNKLAQIADKLCENFVNGKKIVTIAGPSSSNKTTFAKRLAIALRVNGYQSLVIEMDDFYKDNKDIIPGPDGLQDFESIDALNIPILVDRATKLANGEEVLRRKFNFKQGVGYDVEDEKLKLQDRTFLIMEGIHGLNPQLLDALGRDKVTPVYVSAVTPINVDCNHRFPTSDLRLIRRMVRDYRYRGYSPRKTLSRWTSVRKGEEKNIFPYQANAELFFNSALVYELPVLSIYGKGLLSEATLPDSNEDPNSPEAIAISEEARRLLNLLNLFYPVSIEIVPHISCIREFVGGSDLKY